MEDVITNSNNQDADNNNAILIVKKNNMEVYKKLLFIGLIFYSSLFAHSLEIYEVSRDSQEVKNLIRIVKTRFNVFSLKCNYTSIVDEEPYISYFEDKYGKSILDEKKEQALSIKNFEFVFQKGNFVRIQTYTPPKKKLSTIDKPRNLIELLSQKFTTYQQDSNQDKLFQTINYFYNEELKTRDYYYDSMLNKYAYWECAHDNEDMDPYTLDPRICIGLCSGTAFNWGNLWPKEGLFFFIEEFLEKEGIFFYCEEEYKIFWHYVVYEHKTKYKHESNFSFLDPIGIEIWVDKNENISKIACMFYPCRILGLQEVKQIINKDTEITYNTPSILYWEYQYQNYKEFESGIRIPLKTTVLQYSFDNDNPCFQSIVKKYFDTINKTKNEMDIIKYRTELSACNDISFLSRKIELTIYPESVIVNKLIPEETFIAPKPDISLFKNINEAEQFKNSIERNNSSFPSYLILSLFGLIIILFLTFLTYKFWRWSI
ncbi:MAG: hypothetical protein ACP5KS_07735 [Candidatus Hydrogenedens sp.]